MAAFSIPDHDLILVDRPEDNIDEFTYYLQDKIVLICKVIYIDAGKHDVESVEYSRPDNGN